MTSGELRGGPVSRVRPRARSGAASRLLIWKTWEEVWRASQRAKHAKRNPVAGQSAPQKNQEM